MIIAIDFDGTCVTHEYPETGRDIGAEKALKALVDAYGHQLILWTMRSGQCLARAVEWFAQHDIKLYGIQTNPVQQTWTTSPKAYAELYIDDAALGVPLIIGAHERPYVDWPEVMQLLKKKGVVL